MHDENGLERVARAVASLRGGDAVLLIDERGAGSGDVVVAAQVISAEQVNFMAKHARGLVSVGLSEERVAHLRLPPMVATFGDRTCAATRCIEARHGVTTGISAAERALTLRTAASPNATHEDLVSPGHVFPIRAASWPGRVGRIEASVELVRRAGFESAAALCAVLDEQGEIADAHTLARFADAFDLQTIRIADVVVSMSMQVADPANRERHAPSEASWR